MNRIITIMPDFGNAPYAWIKNEDGPESDKYIGVCIADALFGFDVDFNVSRDLQKAFALWAYKFDTSWEEMNWEEFHDQGLKLSRRLYEELNSEFTVRYMKPHEDPDYFGFLFVISKCPGHEWTLTWPNDPEEYTCVHCGIKTLK